MSVSAAEDDKAANDWQAYIPYVTDGASMKEQKLLGY